MGEETAPEQLTVDEGVDAGGTVDPSSEGATPSTDELARTEGALAEAALVDGTGNGALLSVVDQDTGGPGQEMSAGEG